MWLILPLMTIVVFSGEIFERFMYFLVAKCEPQILKEIGEFGNTSI